MAPTYGGPITRMTPVYAEADGEEQFMLYATHEKVLGSLDLMRWSFFDGFPSGKTTECSKYVPSGNLT